MCSSHTLSLPYHCIIDIIVRAMLIIIWHMPIYLFSTLIQHTRVGMYATRWYFICPCKWAAIWCQRRANLSAVYNMCLHYLCLYLVYTSVIEELHCNALIFVWNSSEYLCCLCVTATNGLTCVGWNLFTHRTAAAWRNTNDQLYFHCAVCSSALLSCAANCMCVQNASYLLKTNIINASLIENNTPLLGYIWYQTFGSCNFD